MDLSHRPAETHEQTFLYENVQKCNESVITFRVTQILKSIAANALSISYMPCHFILTYIVITQVKHSI